MNSIKALLFLFLNLLSISACCCYLDPALFDYCDAKTEFENQVCDARKLTEANRPEEALEKLLILEGRPNLSQYERELIAINKAYAYFELGSLEYLIMECDPLLSSKSSRIRLHTHTLYVRALIAADKSPDSAHIAFLLSNPILTDSADSLALFNRLGVYYATIVEFSKSEDYFNQCKLLSLKFNLSTRHSILENYALFLKITGKVDEALALFEKLERLKIENEANNSALSVLYWNRAWTYETAGQYQEALVQFHKYDSLSKHSYQSEKNQIISELEVKYRTREKELLLEEARLRNQSQRAYYGFSLLVLSLIGAVIYINLLLKKNKLAKEQERLNKEKAQQEQAIAQLKVQSLRGINEGQEMERTRISRELHDGLGANLGLLKLTLTANSQLNAATERVIENSVQLIRRLSHDLSSETVINDGLEAAIKDFVQYITRYSKIEITYKVNLRKIKAPYHIEFYRILQELVNNTLKHAYATKVNIEVTEVEEGVKLVYQDNGIGFDLNKPVNGIGLANIRHRCKIFETEPEFYTQPGSGFTCVISVKKAVLGYDSSTQTEHLP